MSTRSSWSFDIRFRDRGSSTAQAVELDVFVEPLPVDPEEKLSLLKHGLARRVFAMRLEMAVTLPR